jgi:general secretion pathway protein I
MIKQFHRRGLSLMEVILAIAILGGSMAVIGQLLHLGSRNAAMARDLTLAQLYCETKVNEILVGSILPEAISDVELDETSAKGEWLYKIDVLGTETPGVIAVTVTVGQNPNIITRPASFSISRLMVEPQMVEELAAQDTALKQAFAAAKTAAEGAMSGTVAYTANSGGAAAGGGAGGGGFGGGGDRGGRRRDGGEDGGRGRGGDGEDGGKRRREGGGEDDGRKRRITGPPGPVDPMPPIRIPPPN